MSYWETLNQSPEILKFKEMRDVKHAQKKTYASPMSSNLLQS